MGLVVKWAITRQERGLDYEDLVSEGTEGLMIAASRWDFRLGYKFSTYAKHWIMQKIEKGILERGSLIRPPSRVQAAMRDIYTAQEKRMQELGRYVSVQELLDVPGAGKWIRDAIAAGTGTIAGRLVSLDAPAGDDEDLTIGSVIAADDPEVGLDLEKKELQEHVAEALDTLTPRERKILELRYGIGGEGPLTLEQIAGVIGLTRERVRQLQEKALRTLRVRERREKLQAMR